MRPLTFKILRELSDVHFTSGAALAAQFGVSRSAISDALMEASDNGVDIFKLTRCGYKLAAPLDLLNLEQIRQHLGRDKGRVDIDIVDTIESTNTELARRSAMAHAALTILPSGICLAAELQTAGRGRRGRQWQSGLGTSLTFSLLWRFEKGAAQLGGLSLVVGLAIAKALRALGVVEAQVKWPNDILVGLKNHEKLAGILIETQGDMLGPTVAVIGIGINVNLPDAIQQTIDQPVTDIASHTHAFISRNQILAALLGELTTTLGKFSGYGFNAFRDEWIAHHAYQNQVVRVMQSAGESFEATVVGVAADGSLLVRLIGSDNNHGHEGQGGHGGQEIALSSAEISVRPAASIKTAATKQFARA